MEWQLILGVFGMGLAGFLGTMYMRVSERSSRSLRQKNSDLEDLVKHYKAEMRRFKSRYANSKALPKVEGSPDDIEGVISAIAPKIMDKFPEIKGLLGEGEIKGLIEEAKKHPELTSKILSKFISTGKKKENEIDTTVSV